MKRPKINRYSAILKSLFAFSLYLLGGCSSPTTSISGLVTLNGEPVPGALVTFAGPNNLVGAATTGEDGRYVMTQAPKGTVKVSVMNVPETKIPEATGKPIVDVDLPKPSGGNANSAKTKKTVKIPEKYKNAEKSGLTFEIGSGTKTIDIPLKDLP